MIHERLGTLQLERSLLRGGGLAYGNLYLTIIPRARMGSASIALEAKGRMGY